MTYNDLTTVEDVQSFFLNITFSELTKPTLDTVSRWIQEATSLVYSTLSSAYLLPITDTEDLTCLKLIAEDYVLENINYTLGRNRLSVDNHGMQVAKVVKHTSFYEKLARITEGETLLNSTRSAVYVSYASVIEDELITYESDKSSVSW